MIAESSGWMKGKIWPAISIDQLLFWPQAVGCSVFYSVM